MRVRGLILPVLAMIAVLATACMPLESIIVSSTGSAPTPVESVETAAPVTTPPATVELTPTAPPAPTFAPPATGVVTATLPAMSATPVAVTPAGDPSAAATPGAAPTNSASLPTSEAVRAPATPITPTAVVSPTLEVPGMPALPEMNTYRDEIGGFEIDYPAGWHLLDVETAVKQEATGYSITMTSWEPQEPGGQGYPEGGSKVDVSVTKGQADTPEEAAEARRAEIAAGDSESEIVYEEPWELASGLAAVHWTVQPSEGPLIHEVVTALNGNRVVVSGLGDAELFEQIAVTLRPLALTASAGQEAAALAAPDPLTAKVAAGGAATPYTVRSGDTLGKIAARFGVTVRAILTANPQITNPDRIYIGQRILIPTSGGTQPPPAGVTRIQIFMVGEGSGSVGCGDAIVAIRRDVPKTPAPLTAALNLLLAQKGQYYGESGLYNALYQSNLRIAGISRSGNAWTIRLAGTLTIGGTCDAPRVKAQLEQTALQFSTVRSVRYLVNGQSLETVLSSR